MQKVRVARLWRREEGQAPLVRRSWRWRGVLMALTPRRRKERRPGKGNTRAGSPRRTGVFLSLSLFLSVCVSVCLCLCGHVSTATLCVFQARRCLCGG